MKISKSTSILFLIIFLLLLLNINNKTKAVISSKEIQTNESTSNVLVLFENIYDHTLAINISNTDLEHNFTLIGVNSVSNINNFLLHLNLSYYSDLILIFSSEIQNINETVFKEFSNLSSNGVSITIISSKIWQLSIPGVQFFGVSPTNRGPQEIIPTQKDSGFNFIIKNTSILNIQGNFSINQEVQSFSKLAFINVYDSDTEEIISTSEIAISQNKSDSSGIFVKQNITSESLLVSIPVSIQDLDDNQSISFISTVARSIVSYSNVKIISSEIITTRETQNTFNSNLISSDTEIIGGILVISSVAAGGFVSYKILPKVIKKEEDEQNLEKQEIELWTRQEPIYFGLLTLIIATISFFKATLYSKRFNRLSVFQVNENPVRRSIIEILELSGFEHFNSLQKKLQIGVSILMWHLQVLQDFNIVETEKFGQYRVFFLVEFPPDPHEVQFYCNIRSKTAFEIIKIFLQKDCWSIENLSSILYSSSDLVRYHCNKLAKLNILHFKGDEKAFSLNNNFKPILINLLQKHPNLD
jgi:predicted transcriptional regulator